MVVKLIKELNQHGIFVRMVDGNLKIQAKTKNVDPELLAKLKAAKQDIIDFLSAGSDSEQSKGEASQGAIPRVADQHHSLPLSFGQQSLWFMEQLDSDSGQYNMASAFKLMGQINIAAMQQALNVIVERHEVLRTLFLTIDHQPAQQVQPVREVALERVDLSDMEQQAQDTRVNQLREQEAYQPFDLAKDLMVRVKLLKLSDDAHVVLFTLHHIASDGGSIGLLVNEFVTLYQAFSNHQPNPLTPLSVQYGDYAYWQRHTLGEEAFEQQFKYWQQKLADAPVLHSLPIDNPRPAKQAFEGASVSHHIDAQTLAAMNKLAEANGVSLFMLIHAVLALFIGRYSNEQDILVGSPMAGRDKSELQPLIGYFVNTLIYRTNLTDVADFNALLAQTRTTALEAYDNQMLPFEMLVNRLNIERSLDHTPLHQITLSLATEQQTRLELPNLVIENFAEGMDRAKVDIEITVSESANGLTLGWLYATSLFEQESMVRMTESFATILADVVAHPSKPLSQIAVMGDAQKSQIIALNDTAVSVDTQSCIQHLFEQAALEHGDETALIYDDEETSYAQLDSLSNQLAHQLIADGVAVGDKVGICLPRSDNMLISILAILKAGGCYVPIDAGYPQQRIDYLLQDSAVKVVLCCKKQTALLEKDGLELLVLDDSQTKTVLKNQAKDKPKPSGLNAQCAAYMIYTSGSTGQPKGVELSHASATNYIQFAASTYLDDEKTGSVVSSPLAFDATITTLFTPLIVGKSVELLLDDDSVLEQLVDYLSDDDESLLFKITPAHLDALVSLMPNEGIEAEHTIVIGGEQLTCHCLNPWREKLLPQATYVNEYGPTETVVGCCIHTLKPGDDVTQGAVPIGKAIANTQLYVLSHDLAEQTVGAAGELYIGGAGLAIGYFQRSELTAERFVDAPFTPQRKLYRTGDLVRRKANGDLEFLGRVDEQVKVRGYRIELAEIEVQLNQIDDISESAVICRVHSQTQGNENELFAYIVANKSVNADEAFIAGVKTQLAKQLPEYMVPTFIMALDELPLTSNGKVDKKNLPTIEVITANKGYEAPQTKTEMMLVQTWQDILGVDRIGVNTDFFSVGGNSLLATRVVSAVNESDDKKLSVRAMFEYRTVGELATHLDQMDASSLNKLVPISRDGDLPLSFSQQRLWFIEQLDKGSVQYLMPARLRFKGALDLQAFRSALDQTFERHETLRTTFPMKDQAAVQLIHDAKNFPLEELDLSSLSADEQAQALQDIALKESQTPFDLSIDFPMRGILATLGDNVHDLFFTMHHIASDAWSMDVWAREFIALYHAFSQGKPNPLKPLDIQFSDYAHWQRKMLEDESFQRQLDYWQDNLDGIPQVHHLPLDYPRPATQDFVGITYASYIDRQTTDGIYQLASKHNASLYMFLQTTFALLVSRWSDQDDIVVGSPIAGRVNKLVEPLIGFFVNNLVLRTDLSDDPSFERLLAQGRDTALNAFDNQDVPFDMLIEKLQIERSLTHAPAFQLVFDLQNNVKAQLSIPEVEISDETGKNDSVNYDLELHALESNDGIRFNWIFAKNLFDIRTIETMGRSFEMLIKGILAAPELPVSQYPILAPSDKQLHDNWNDNGVEFDRQNCVHRQFEAQAAAHPNKVAVSSSYEKVTYQELNEQANQVAHYLIENGVVVDEVVAICIERGVDMLVGMLGIAKAGGAYLPIDPAYPNSRVEHILTNSKARFVLTDQELMGSLPIKDQQVLPIDEEIRETLLANFDDENPSVDEVKQSIDNLAYVIYTSGSTGEPVGVMNTHRGLSNLCHWHARYYQFDDSSKGSHLASIGFDAAVWEVWPLLANGGEIVVISDGDRDNPRKLLRLIEKNQVTHSFLPTGLMEVMSELGLYQVKGLRYLLTGGDKLSNQPGLKDSQVTLVNNYGPSEAAVVTSCHTLDSQRDYVPPIGAVIDNFKGYVMDSHQQQVPVGVVGELYIGGEGLARGYLNNDQLTEQRFIQKGDLYQQFGRLYRTGDMVRRLHNGELEFAGRIDEQVKIRGFRIDLKEIEALLNEQDILSRALVVVKESGGNKHIVAYISADMNKVMFKDDLTDEYDLIDETRRIFSSENSFIDEIRHIVRHFLPLYMVPAAFVMIQSMPLTANGKIDRRALPDPEDLLLQGHYVAPENEIEQALAEIWSELLDIAADKISTTANFFEIGGHSLLAIKILVKMKERLNISVEVKDLFGYSDIKSLSAFVEQQLSEAGEVDESKQIKRVDEDTDTEFEI